MATTHKEQARVITAGAEAGGGQAASPSEPTRKTSLPVHGQSSPTNFSESVLKHIKALSSQVPDFETLTAFLTQAQGHGSAETRAILQQSPEGHGTFEALMRYYASPQSDILSPAKDMPSEDLSYPMANYFISSSHNTYLTGNQLYSDASADSYKSVLLRGCRCVEIDVWDGKAQEEEEQQQQQQQQQPQTQQPEPSTSFERKGWLSRHFSRRGSRPNVPSAKNGDAKNGNATKPEPWRAGGVKPIEPRVLHGYTLTKEVTFRDVCESIKENAFVSSHLPLIVSMEIHASLESQQTIVDIIEECWKEMLVHTPGATSTNEPEYSATLPAPQDLRDKILVKVKYTPPEDAKGASLDATAPAMMRAASVSKKRAPPKKPERTSSSSSSSDDPAGDGEKAKKKKKMLDTLSRLGVYTRAYHFSSFDQPEAKIPTHVFSLSEGAFTEAHATMPEALAKHNRRFLMRAYPKGTRVSSSNLDPSPFWAKGVQMVALNWQKCDKSVMLNEAMFAGSHGWILKPISMRGSRRPSPSDTAAPPTSTHLSPTSSLATGQFLDMTIEFLAAQNLPLPMSEESAKGFKPYVKCVLHINAPDDPMGSLRISRRRSLSEKGATLVRRRSTSRGPPPAAVGHDGASNSQQEEQRLKQPKLKARTSHQRGTDPDFFGDALTFPRVPVGEEALSFVRFKVMDAVGLGRDEMAAWACVRLDRMRNGVRWISLFTAHGQKCDGALLVKISKTVSAAPPMG